MKKNHRLHVTLRQASALGKSPVDAVLPPSAPTPPPGHLPGKAAQGGAAVQESSPAWFMVLVLVLVLGLTHESTSSDTEVTGSLKSIMLGRGRVKQMLE